MPWWVGSCGVSCRSSSQWQCITWCEVCCQVGCVGTWCPTQEIEAPNLLAVIKRSEQSWRSQSDFIRFHQISDIIIVLSDFNRFHALALETKLARLSMNAIAPWNLSMEAEKQSHRQQGSRKQRNHAERTHSIRKSCQQESNSSISSKLWPKYPKLTLLCNVM